MILIIDNYDSFTYNLVQYVHELGAETRVVRNDSITSQEIERMLPKKIIISPGPCSPREAGISLDVIRLFQTRVPILGVCLGHQAIGDALGGTVIRNPVPVHGKVSKVFHTDSGIFHGIENPFDATRYHSLMLERDSLPSELTVTAWTADGTVMGIESTRLQLYGVQFHPESILTTEGKKILNNFLRL
jgi:anthranilate synthase component II